MKKNKMYFDTNFWAAYEAENPLEALYSFFDFAHLHCYKEILCEAFLYVHKKKVYKKDYPGQVIVFYTALRSFLKVCFLLQYKNKKWKVKKPSDCMSKLHLASLTMEEYENPFLVFQRVFAEKTIDEFEFFLFEVIHLSLSRCTEEFDYDLITPYIYLIKMLDASQLMRERGIEKIKNNVQS